MTNSARNRVTARWLRRKASPALILSLLLAATSVVSAEGRTSIQRSSPNHTTIVIHDTSPAAYKARSAQAKRAQERLDRRRQRAEQLRDEQRQRDHELKVLRLKNESKTTAQATPKKEESSVEEPQQTRRKRSSFFNGGRSTMVPSWNGYAYGGFGYPIGFGYGFGYPAYGFGPAWGGYGFRNRGFRGRGYRGCR